MEDQSKYMERDKPEGLTEVLRIYYDKNELTVEEFLLLELVAGTAAHMNQWKLFKAVPSKIMNDFLLLGKN